MPGRLVKYENGFVQGAIPGGNGANQGVRCGRVVAYEVPLRDVLVTLPPLRPIESAYYDTMTTLPWQAYRSNDGDELVFPPSHLIPSKSDCIPNDPIPVPPTQSPLEPHSLNRSECLYLLDHDGVLGSAGIAEQVECRVVGNHDRGVWIECGKLGLKPYLSTGAVGGDCDILSMVS